jgi:hypothetical protein
VANLAINDVANAKLHATVLENAKLQISPNIRKPAKYSLRIQCQLLFRRELMNPLLLKLLLSFHVVLIGPHGQLHQEVVPK